MYKHVFTKETGMLKECLPIPLTECHMFTSVRSHVSYMYSELGASDVK